MPALYFAYGSNMDAAQMRARCPSARFESVARLYDYALAFGGWSARWSGPVATVIPALGEHVDGVLWLITGTDLFALDAYEGVPYLYSRTLRPVVDAYGREQHPWVYLLQRDASRYWSPSIEYHRRIWTSYDRLGFDKRPLRRAGVRA